MNRVDYYINDKLIIEIDDVIYRNVYGIESAVENDIYSEVEDWVFYKVTDKIWSKVEGIL